MSYFRLPCHLVDGDRSDSGIGQPSGLGLIFLLVAFLVCGGIVIWLIISEGIRHTRQAESSNQ